MHGVWTETLGKDADAVRNEVFAQQAGDLADFCHGDKQDEQEKARNSSQQRERQFPNWT